MVRSTMNNHRCASDGKAAPKSNSASTGKKQANKTTDTRMLIKCECVVQDDLGDAAGLSPGVSMRLRSIKAMYSGFSALFC